MTAKEIVPDKELDSVWSRLYYGTSAHPRNKLREILLKIACNYSIGGGSTRMVSELRLIDESEVVLKLNEKGRRYLYAAFEPDFTNQI